MCECVFMCVFVCVCVFMCINAGMPNCPASDQSGTGRKKLTMPGLVRYRTKPRQSGIFLVRYRTGIIDAGMSMPALVSTMPMPSYVCMCDCGHRGGDMVVFPPHPSLDCSHSSGCVCNDRPGLLCTLCYSYCAHWSPPRNLTIFGLSI
jgi:hypothetical protein